MFCPYCGKPVPEGGRYCSNCGKSIPFQNPDPTVSARESAPQPASAPEPSVKREPSPKPKRVNVLALILGILLVGALVLYFITDRNSQAEKAELQKQIDRSSVAFLSDFTESILDSSDEYVESRRFHEKSYYEVLMACGIDSSRVDHAVWYVSDQYPDEILLLKLHDGRDAEEIKTIYTSYAERKYLGDSISSVEVFDKNTDEFLGLFLISTPEFTSIEAMFDDDVTISLFHNLITRAWMYHFSY